MNSAVQRALPTDPAHLRAAFSKLGINEVDNAPEVRAMFAAAGHPEIRDTRATPWCAAFVAWCLKQAGLPNTGSLMARSYLKYGTACDLSKRIPRGAICIWPRGEPPSGHVDFCIYDDGQYVTTIDGNVSDGVAIRRRRKSEILGARLAANMVKPPAPPDIESVPLPTPKPAPQDTELPDPEPPPAQPKSFLERVWLWITGTLFAGGMGIGGVTLNGDTFKWLTVFGVVAFFCFIAWVWGLPPRGTFWKGIFRARQP